MSSGSGFRLEGAVQKDLSTSHERSSVCSALTQTLKTKTLPIAECEGSPEESEWKMRGDFRVSARTGNTVEVNSTKE